MSELSHLPLLRSRLYTYLRRPFQSDLTPLSCPLQRRTVTQSARPSSSPNTSAQVGFPLSSLQLTSSLTVLQYTHTLGVFRWKRMLLLQQVRPRRGGSHPSRNGPKVAVVAFQYYPLCAKKNTLQGVQEFLPLFYFLSSSSYLISSLLPAFHEKI